MDNYHESLRKAIPRHWILAAQRKTNFSCDIKRVKVAALAIGNNGQVMAVETNRKLFGHGSKRSYHAEEFLVRSLRNKRIKNIRYIIILRVKDNKIYLINPCILCNRYLKINNIKYLRVPHAMEKVN